MNYRYISTEEAIKSTDWAAGARIPVSSVEVLGGPPAHAVCNVIPALAKIFDEVLVNALDHSRRPGGATKINVTTTPNGITIWNNGAGIECVQLNIPELGGLIWLPTVLFSAFNQTTNRRGGDITGGVNGLGVKIVAVMCLLLSLKTRDSQRGLLFQQQWTQNKTVVGPPTVAASPGPGFTEVTFQPDYTGCFGGFTYDAFLPQMYGRTMLAAVSTVAEVTFNGVVLPRDQLILLRELTPLPGFSCDVGGPAHPWRLSVQPGGHCALSVVNGMVVRRGPHMQAIEQLLVNSVGAAVLKKVRSDVKIKKDIIVKHLGYILVALIPDPSWEGQRKDVLSGSATQFAGYTLPPKFIRDVAAAASTYIIEQILAKRRRKKSKIDKYFPSTHGGQDSTLYAVEGDSSMAQVKTAIVSNPNLTFKRNGLFSLGGVIVNVRNEITFHAGSNGRLADLSDKLRKNARITAFLEATGLRYDYTYEDPAQRRSLRYGALRMVPDQDYDGKGKILALVLSFIQCCWPALLRQPSYVQWQYSPIARAYPASGGLVRSFYSIVALETWLKSVDSADYAIKYYKGMAGHNAEETIYMFKAPPIYQVHLDARSSELFEVYLGNVPAKRRAVLSQPTQLAELVPGAQGIPCSEYLLCEADAYQRDDLQRKLDNYIDGLTLSGRKILDGCLDKFAKKATPQKVDSIAGYILERKQYEHGQASLAKSIIGKAALYCRQLPQLTPHGMFGSRLNGLDDAGAPRYISAGLNKPLCDLLYPREDYELLRFTHNEGVRGEPQYFIPIIPMAICETTELPSHGWKLQKWAVDALAVIEAAKVMVHGGMILPPLPFYRGNWTGEFRPVGTRIYSVGKYQIHGDSVIITELPLGVWSDPWAKKLADKEDEDPIYCYVDHNGNTEDVVRTKITLRPGALAALERHSTAFFDGIELYFGLTLCMHSDLNMMTEHNSVAEFATYSEIIRAWFPHRRQCYMDRLARRRLRDECRQELIRQTHRFVASGLAMAGWPRDAMESALADANYPRLQPGILTGRFYGNNDEFRAAFYNGDYGYLLNVTVKQTTRESQEKRLAKLAVVATYSTWQEEWLAELAKLGNVIAEGRRTKWQFGTAKRYKFE